MKRIMPFILLFQILSCTTSDKKNFSIAISKSKAYVEHFMDSTKVPGMSLAVLHKGQIIWSKGFGYSDIELKVPVGPKSKFRIASVSKSITAVLTAHLNQNNILDIDIPVHNVLNDFPKKKWDFNIRQLMCHAAGIRHYLDKDTNYTDYHSNIKSGLEIIKNDSLLYKPGSRCSYSSYGYNIIGAFIEKSTGKLLGDILADSLFVPLEMDNTTIDHPCLKNRLHQV